MIIVNIILHALTFCSKNYLIIFKIYTLSRKSLTIVKYEIHRIQNKYIIYKINILLHNTFE